MTQAAIDVRLIERADMQRIVPLLHQRNSALSSQLLSARVEEMVAQGFQCFGAFQRDRLVAIAGFWIKTRYHTGRVIELDAVFVEATHRSRRLGERLVRCILEYGRRCDCLESELHCYTANSGAHRFWMNHGYRIIAFHFGRGL